jgi:TRAP-type C4-dicarboxylate transport system substrate-binding protein
MMGRTKYSFKLLLVAGVSALFSLSNVMQLFAAEDETVKWVYACGWSKKHPQVGILAEKWMDNIRKATDGRVTIKGVYDGALLEGKDTLKGVMQQVADSGALVAAYWPGELPMTTALASTIDLDLGNKLDMKGVSLITMKLLEEFPEFSGEYNKLGITPLVWLPSPAYSFLSVTPLKNLDDFKGKKIRAFGLNMPKLQAAAGAVPLAVSTSEMYTSLQTGVIDAVQTDPPNMFSNKLYEVAKHFTPTGPGKGALCATAAVVYAINNKSLGKLSANDQEIVKNQSRQTTLEGAEFMDKAWDKAIGELVNNGVTIHHLSDADLAKWSANCPDWYALAAEELNKKGLPGTQFVEKYKELAEAYLAGRLQ